MTTAWNTDYRTNSGETMTTLINTTIDPLADMPCWSTLPGTA